MCCVFLTFVFMFLWHEPWFTAVEMESLKKKKKYGEWWWNVFAPIFEKECRFCTFPFTSGCNYMLVHSLFCCMWCLHFLCFSTICVLYRFFLWFVSDEKMCRWLNRTNLNHFSLILNVNINMKQISVFDVLSKNGHMVIELREQFEWVGKNVICKRKDN